MSEELVEYTEHTIYCNYCREKNYIRIAKDSSAEISALKAKCEEIHQADRQKIDEWSAKIDQLEADNAAAKNELAEARLESESWLEQRDTELVKRVALAAKLEEAQKHHKYLEADSDLLREEINEQEKVIERASMLIHRVLQPNYSIDEWAKDAEAFLGEIGGR